MAIVVQEARFPSPLPDIGRIVGTITEICGLPVLVKESGSDIKGNLYELHAHLAFACAPKDHVEIYSYQSGAVQQSYKKMYADMGEFAPKPKGWDEPLGTQMIYLKIYLGQEPTLFHVAILALEKLGGELKKPISEDDRQAYGDTLTPAIFEKRLSKNRWQNFREMGLTLLILPVTFPFWLIRFIVKTPIAIWRACRYYRKV